MWIVKCKADGEYARKGGGWTRDQRMAVRYQKRKGAEEHVRSIRDEYRPAIVHLVPKRAVAVDSSALREREAIASWVERTGAALLWSGDTVKAARGMAQRIRAGEHRK